MRRLLALPLVAALVAMPVAQAVPVAAEPGARPSGSSGAAAEAPESATLVGSLQDELGCDADWQPSCSALTLEHPASLRFRR